MNRVLLTNDDGIDAEGLAALETVARRFFDDVWVVAPAEQASQIGHRVTTDTPLRFEERGEQRYAVHGTPADCTRVALAHLLPSHPDWVWSGINHGGNLGRHDFVISGTVAAAREAAFFGVPAMSTSHYLKRELALCWETAADRIASAFCELRDEETGPGEFWNINLPHLAPDEPSPEFRFCDLEKQPLEVVFEADEEQALSYTGAYHDRPRVEGSDVAVCFSGDVAISRVSI